jgi:NADP-dependent 3-hydroxy acid dehydrogenase YdfG
MTSDPETTRVVVAGATGDVGRGVVEEALKRSWAVTAVARNLTTLQLLETELNSTLLDTVAGDLSSDDSAREVAAHPAVVGADAVVIAVNTWVAERALLEWEPDELLGYLGANLIPHLIAARALLPAVADGGTFMSIGGGTADVVLPGSGHMSITQAAQRMMVRTLDRESTGTTVRIRQLLIAAMVSGHRNPRPRGRYVVPASQVGREVCDRLGHPHRYRETVSTLVP